MDESRMDAIAMLAAAVNNLEDYLVATDGRKKPTINPDLVRGTIVAMRTALESMGVIDDDEPFYTEDERVSFIRKHLAENGMFASPEEVGAVLDGDEAFMDSKGLLMAVFKPDEDM